MQIVCPACAARYDVPEARLAPGKRVQCARCEDRWAPIPAETVERPAPEDEEFEAEMVGPAASMPTRPASIAPPPILPPPMLPPPAAHRGGRLVWVGWVLTVIVVAALAVAAHEYRPQIERAWPPSARLYGLL